MNKRSTGEGRGKLIVFGEHAVVYGQPAVACSLPRGATAELSFSESSTWSIVGPDGPLPINADIKRAGRALLGRFDLSPEQLDIDIELTIPVGVGLGSSAALAVALARAAADLQEIDDARLFSEAVAAAETVFHGNPSGIDQRAARGGGFFRFHRGDNDSTKLSPLDVPPGRWMIANVAPSASTLKMVESVATLRRRQPAVIDSLLDEFGNVATAGAQALADGRWQHVGDLMNLNQGLLNAVGVSTPTLEAACADARHAGALGAKLTGSGGGGCIVVLADADRIEAVEEALAEYGDVYAFSLPADSQ